jgi:hypothetical protein
MITIFLCEFANFWAAKIGVFQLHVQGDAGHPG